VSNERSSQSHRGGTKHALGNSTTDTQFHYRLSSFTVHVQGASSVALTDSTRWNSEFQTVRTWGEVFIFLPFFRMNKTILFSRESLVVGWLVERTTERGHHHERDELMKGRQKLVQQSLSGVHVVEGQARAPGDQGRAIFFGRQARGQDGMPPRCSCPRLQASKS
jgi:hypothetical protein